MFFDGNSFFIDGPNKHLEDLPSGFISAQGHLRMPLHGPEEGLAGQTHCLDEIIHAAGHLCKPWCQGLERLMMAVVDAQLLLLQ